MKLIPYDAKKARSMTYTRSNNLKILEEFIESGLECAKVEDFTQKDAESCCNSLKSSIRHYGMTSIQCFYRKGDVFLLRKL